MKSNIFQSLITVISIISAFVLASLLYYVGKFDSQKKDYVLSLTNRTKEVSQFIDELTGLRNVIESYRKGEDNSYLDSQWIFDKVNDLYYKLNKIRKNVDSNMENLIKRFEERAQFLRWNMKRILASFILSLFVCFIGLFYSDAGPNDNVWPTLIFAVFCLYYTMKSFYEAWNTLTSSSDTLDKYYLRDLN